MEKNCMTDIYKTYKKDTDKTYDEDFDTGNTYYDDDYIESENENDDKYLEEDTHARYAKPSGDKIASYNNALTYAKKENKQNRIVASFLSFDRSLYGIVRKRSGR